MPPYANVSSASEIFDVMNPFSVNGGDINSHDTAAKELQIMFENSCVSEVDNHPPNANDPKNEQNLGFLLQISAKRLSIFYEASLS